MEICYHTPILRHAEACVLWCRRDTTFQQQEEPPADYLVVRNSAREACTLPVLMLVHEFVCKRNGLLKFFTGERRLKGHA